MRILAAFISMGRVVFGVAFIAEPKLMERAWIGKQARVRVRNCSRAPWARATSCSASAVCRL
jgi:hypothetical protein